jgi:iron complex outermembrane receptor protein
LKLLYGEAFQEPSARLRYGAWTGTGSDPNILPEESRTLEASVTRITDRMSHHVSLYNVKNTNTILVLADGARNVGQRDVIGLDYHVKAQFYPSFMKRFDLWGYYSYMHGTGDEIYNATTDSYEEGDIGDLADHKIYFGTTSYFNDKFLGTVRGRFIGQRDTIASNPVPSVDSYFTLDLYFTYKLVKNFGLGVRVDNLLDAKYFHPGIRDANSGVDPGFWDANGAWSGSQGWYNSLVPQAGRTITALLKFDF